MDELGHAMRKLGPGCGMVGLAFFAQPHDPATVRVGLGVDWEVDPPRSVTGDAATSYRASQLQPKTHRSSQSSFLQVGGPIAKIESTAKIVSSSSRRDARKPNHRCSSEPTSLRYCRYA
jgi:hypothetical protein